MSFKPNKIAKKIVKANKEAFKKALAECEDNKQYATVKQMITPAMSAIKEKYNKGKFVTNNEQHQLVWAIINEVTGKSSSALVI